MQKTIMTFLMWFMIALVGLPVFMLSMPPGKAQAATKAEESFVPVTQIVTSPKHPNANGWFDQVTTIKLKATDDAETYYQWNSATGAWQIYDQPIEAWRGTNTLYYYSKSAVAKEAIQSRLIQVDFNRPAEPVVKAESAEDQAVLSWERRADIETLRIAKNGKNLAQVPAKSAFYLDGDVRNGQIYVYKFKAISPSGLKSKAVKVPVTITSQGTIAAIQPSIGQGVMTQQVVKQVAAQAQKVEVAPAVPPTEPIKPLTKNWNRLFIALSILIIAAGAAIAGYYGYEWWASRQERQDEPRDKKSDRW